MFKLILYEIISIKIKKNDVVKNIKYILILSNSNNNEYKNA